jgi:hypothetical protein
MLVAFLVISLFLTFGCTIWMFVIIFRRSVVGGVLSLLFALPVFYYLFTGWGKEGEDIRMPFFLSLAPLAIAIVMGAMYINSEIEARRRGELPSERVLRQEAPVDRKTRTSAPAVAKEPVIEAPAATPAPAPVAKPRPVVQHSEPVRMPVKEVPPKRKAESACVFKPVMTDEDMAKCR